MPAQDPQKPRPDPADETTSRAPDVPSTYATPAPDSGSLGAAADSSGSGELSDWGSLERPAPSFAPGQIVGERYRIVRFIAAGGMGEVYEAEDTVLGAEVALKTIRPEVARGHALERFRREILLARRVTHPNVCRIFDVGHHAAASGVAIPIVFLTMELVRGETLRDHVRAHGRLGAEAALPIARQMAAALAAAHQAGVVHRDFKSANVMLAPGRAPGDPPRVVVTDFGLARTGAGDGDTLASITRSDHFVGTPAYMAPEQIEGAEVTSAADVYALGVVLYEMVTGRLPFVGDSPLSTVLKRFREEPSSPRLHAPALDAVWEHTILRCLARDPAERFATGQDVVDALGGLRGARLRRRLPNLGRPAALAAGVLALAAGGAYLWTQRSTPRPAAEAPQASPARRSVAVVGFRNLSGRRETGWLATALSEMLASELAAGEKLRTVPGENVARMKVELALADADTLAPDSLARIRGHIGADVIVLGSYLAAGGEDARRIRVDLRLQETASGETVASITETGSEDEILDLVSRAGARLRASLGVGDLSASERGELRASRPASPEAARLYAEGIAKLRSFDAQSARALFERAVAADPAHAPAYAALADAWSTLGYETRAAEAARQAYERAAAFSREERLVIEGRLHAATHDWPRAIEVYRSLWTFFPDDLEHGLRLAAAQTAAGQGEAARETVEQLRKLQPPGSEDPRLDLTAALAAEAHSDFKAQRELAAGAAAKAGARQASLIVARARLAEATALRYLGQPKAAVAACEEGRRLYEKGGDRGGVAYALLLLSNGLEDEGDLAGARRAAEESLAIRRAIGDDNGTARTLNTLANVLDAQGDMRGARTRRDEALALFRKVGNRYGMAVATFNLANLMAKGGEHDAARTHYEQALTLFREAGNRMGVASALTGLGNESKERGELDAATRHYDEALAIKREIGDVIGESICFSNLAIVAALRGELDASQKHFEASRVAAEKAGNKSFTAVALVGLGELQLRRGDLAQARRLHEQALRMRQEMGEEKTAGESRLYLAFLAIEEGRPMQDEAAGRELPALFRRLGAPEDESYARGLSARLLVEKGDARAARQELDRALALAGTVAPPELRFLLALIDGRVHIAAGDADAASSSLEATAAEARRLKLRPYELDAQLLLAEAELRAGRRDAARKRLKQLEADARTLGLGLIAKRAAALAEPPLR
jgi:tetratricopeptide (TPR) repeat protein